MNNATLSENLLVRNDLHIFLTFTDLHICCMFMKKVWTAIVDMTLQVKVFKWAYQFIKQIKHFSLGISYILQCNST